MALEGAQIYKKRISTMNYIRNSQGMVKVKVFTVKQPRKPYCFQKYLAEISCKDYFHTD